MSDLSKLNVRYSNFGLNLAHDQSTLPFGKFTYLSNVVSTIEGNLRPRLGQTRGHVAAIPGAFPVLGFRRLNNSVAGTSKFIIRASSGLYVTSGTAVPFTISSLASSFGTGFGSISIYRPSLSSVVWGYVFDGTKMVKTDGTNVHPIGYPRPHSIHTTGAQDFTATVGAVATGSLSQSTTYTYRFALYCSTTGAESLYNLIPDGAILTDVTATTDTTHLNIDVKIAALDLSSASYTGVDKVRIYRVGGTVNTWKLITTQAYTGATITYNDSAADSAVQALDDMDTSSDQPFTCTNTSGVDVAGVALPYATEPYLGYILATGDPNNPGFVYWTNKFDPDRQDPDNRVEVTSPQDPIQNILIYNGRPYVFSKEGLFELYIGLAETTTFTPSKTSCGRGLFTPLAYTVGPEIYFLSKDGIYATSGGVERSITDDELRPIFQGTTTINGVTAVDFSQTSYIRMGFFKNELWFQYRDTNNNTQYLIYDVRYRRWRHAAFRNNTNCLYEDEDTTNLFWMGTTDGFLVQHSGTADEGGSPTTIPCAVGTGNMTFGAPLINKEFVQLIIDVDPAGSTMTFNADMNNVLGTQVIKQTTSNSATRTKVYMDLGPTFAEDFLLYITWAASSGTPILYGYELFYRPEEPEMTVWNTTGVDHGLSGWQIVRSGYFSYLSNGTLTLTVSVMKDNGTFSTSTYSLPNSNGQMVKVFVPFNPTKGKLFFYGITCNTATKFRFYAEESEVHVKPWVTAFGYAKVNPFTDSHSQGSMSSDGGGSGAQGGVATPQGGGYGGVGNSSGPGILGNPGFNGSGFDFGGGGGTPPDAAQSDGSGWLSTGTAPGHDTDESLDTGYGRDTGGGSEGGRDYT